MEIRRLSYFVRIAEDGSLTKAAGVLRIAQPALSRQMRLLEEELGVSLFSRTARGMQLTEEGEHLRGSVTGPLRALELALQSVRSYASRIEGNVTIGMPSAIGDLLAGDLAWRMGRDFPKIALRLAEAPNGSLIEWLNRGVIDFALIEEPSNDVRLVDKILRRDPLLLVGPPGDPLLDSGPVGFRTVAGLPLIVPTHHVGLRSILDVAAARAKLALDIRVEADSPRLARQLVAGGAGYAVLPEAYCGDALRMGRLSGCAIESPALTLTTCLAWRKNGRATGERIEAAVIEVVEGVVA
jgi:LysR family nitrogen assimilation transcriptional regulator